MAKRRLRIVKTVPDYLGVCERCGEQFPSQNSKRSEARAEVGTAFDVHACKPLDESQNALRVVRQATENK